MCGLGYRIDIMASLSITEESIPSMEGKVAIITGKQSVNSLLYPPSFVF